MARKNSTADSIIPVWVQRLQALLEERDMKQSELAAKLVLLHLLFLIG